MGTASRQGGAIYIYILKIIGCLAPPRGLALHIFDVLPRPSPSSPPSLLVQYLFSFSNDTKFRSLLQNPTTTLCSFLAVPPSPSPFSSFFTLSEICFALQASLVSRLVEAPHPLTSVKKRSGEETGGHLAQKTKKKIQR
jgi:hypothetical protein